MHLTSEFISHTINNMRKIVVFIASAGLYITAASQVFAISACPTTSQFAGLCTLDASGIQKLIGPAVTFAFVIASLIALAYLIWGGIKWIISQGDKQGVEDARNHIIAAVVGLVLIFLSYLIINLVIGFFAPSASLNNLQLPHL